MTTTRTTSASAYLVPTLASALSAGFLAGTGIILLTAPVTPVSPATAAPVTTVASVASTPKVPTDKQAARIAGKQCATVTDDDTWEACNLGYFQEITGKALTADDYESGATSLVIDHASRRYQSKRNAKPSPADLRAVTTANAQCHYLVKASPATNLYEACEIGAFTMERQRVITTHDYRITATGKRFGALRLTRASRAIAK